MLLALLACSAPNIVQPPDTAGDTAGDTSTDTGAAAWPEGLAPLTTLSEGECPDLSENGPATFRSHGLDRKIRVYLPKERPAGMPMMVVWHWLGSSARQVADVMDLEGMAERTGSVILVPESKDDNQYDWDFWNGLDDDLVMFDDLRTCAVQDLGVDPARISAHGMSAGGLMTTFLSVQRADSLATVSVFSGGTEPVVQWQQPAHPFPALVVYGGDTDLYGSGASQVNFTTTTTHYVDELRENDQFVVLCNHGLGHTLPPETDDMVIAWNLTHVYGEDSPYLDGDISAFPDYCGVVP